MCDRRDLPRNPQDLITVPKTQHRELWYLVKLFQAIFSLDTGLFNIIVNSVKDCTLSNKRQ